jgi:regulator of protease activity HflC (stomatin/prohibitin superfamily)
MKRFTLLWIGRLLVPLLSLQGVDSSSKFWGKAAVVGTVGTACCLGCLRIVTSGNEVLVERFGCYHRRWGPGWHFLVPIVEKISFRGTNREQVLDVPPQQCYTLDNAPLKADAVVYMRIVNMEAARYNVMGLDTAILNLCLTQLREEVGKLTLDECFASRDKINTALLSVLNAVCQQWGVQIIRVEIQNLEPSRDILAAMELQMAAEREKRAAILHSEGERVKLINEAEGRAGAVLADAEAKSKSIMLAAQAESERLRMEAQGLCQSIAIISTAVAHAAEMTGGEEIMDATLRRRPKRNLKTPVKTRTLHLSEPYDSRSTTHTAMQPRKVES